jgi:c(7)-type cytochrome triheme protein
MSLAPYFRIALQGIFLKMPCNNSKNTAQKSEMGTWRKSITWLLFPFLFLLSAAQAMSQPDDGKSSNNNSVNVQIPTASSTSPRMLTYQPPAMQYESQSPTSRPASNSFNRLLKVSPRHMPPTDDGIHDPANDGTKLLQPPLEAFANLPKTESDLGNGVHWVRALDDGLIKPLWDINNPDSAPTVLVMDIIRMPRGSMPNELFPHRQHTLWLDCSNCHPSIFIPQKGANQISMAANLLGQKCGVCHGKVAFPFSQCKRCHSQPKVVTQMEGTEP